MASTPSLYGNSQERKSCYNCTNTVPVEVQSKSMQLECRMFTRYGLTVESMAVADQTELADKNSYGGACAYVGGGRDDYCSLDMAVAARLNSIRSEDRDEFFERPHVTADTKQDLSKENEQLIRSNPMYIQLVNEAMVRIGGTLLPSSSSSAATAATEVLAPSAPNAEDDIIFCQHLNVVKRKSGECTPCATCLAGPPGRGKIFDDWGQTVIGYK